MTRKEKQKFKRFKKRHVVPSIVGWLFVGLLLMAAIFFMMGVAESDIIDKKLIAAKKTSTQYMTDIYDYMSDGDSLETAFNKEYIKDDTIFIYDSESGEIIYPNSLQGEYEFTTVDMIFHKYNFAFLKGMKFEDSGMISNNKCLNIDGITFLKKTIQGNRSEELDETPIVNFNGFVGSELTDSDYVVYCSSHISIMATDVRSFLIILMTAVSVIVIVMIVILFSIIRSIINNNRMINALFYDEITNGNNWYSFKVKGGKLIKKNKKEYAVISIKNGKMQSCCTCYGGDAGDKLIHDTYKYINSKLEKKEMVARYAECTFAVLMKYTSLDELKKRIDTIINDIYRLSGDVNGFVHAGIYAIGEINEEDDEEWTAEIEHYYHHAGIACDSSKNKDNTEIVLFDGKLQENHLWEHKVESGMEKALKNEEFVVYLQPKYDPKTKALKGAEALIRWISPEYGFISPGKFIPIFEENGFITKIDDYMISKVAKLQADWINAGFDVIPVSVNVSRAHFAMPDLAEHIGKLVDAYNIPHNVIEIELTESAFFDDKKILMSTVDQLQKRGFHVSMDDFGSGYSSLNSLKDLPLDVLKLDAEFFRGENADERGEVIVEKAIELAKNLEMEIVAEGVEKKEQVEFLADAGCDMIQGFYFDKPMPVNEFETRMTRNSKTIEIVDIGAEEK